MQDQRIYAFGPFQLDARTRLLERGGEPVTLTPKIIDTLLALVENRDRLLSKEELMTAIWPDTHVEEGNLVSNISILRKTLGETDDGRPYIQTVPKRGYRFAADVVESREQETILAVRESHRSRVVLEEEETNTRSGWLAALWIGCGMLVLAGAAVWMRLASGTASAPVSLAQLTTDSGYEGEPTFAPDSRTIAYVSDRTGNFDIFLKQVSGGPDINLTNGAGDNIQPSFSPDGRRIAFVSSRSGSVPGTIVPSTDNPPLGGDIWVMPAFGGSARRVVEAGNFPSWSPDGASILYVSGPWFKRKILRVNADGGQPQEVALRFRQSEMVPGSLFYPTYSPDSKWILFQGGDGIYVVSGEGGEPATIGKGRSPAWDAGGKAIVYSSAEPGRNLNLSILPFSTGSGRVSGPPRPLTVGRGRDVHAAPAQSGKLIAYAATEQTTNVESLPFDAETGRVKGKAQPVTTGNHAIGFMDTSPDGRFVVFGSDQGIEVWPLHSGSSGEQRMANPAFSDKVPRWSPDGRVIAMERQPANKPEADTDLWLMEADGGNPRLLVQAAVGLRWLPDSAGAVYFSRPERQLCVLSLADRHVRRLTNEPDVMPITAVSSDGKWVAYQSTAAGNVDIRAIPIGGGASRAVVATPHQDYHPFFSPSGNWLYFYPDHKNIYRVPGPAQNWKHSEPEEVTHFAEIGLPLLEDPQITRDGRQLLYTRGRTSADIWILRR